MHWLIAGAIAGVAAYLTDWLMWGKLFTKGMDDFFSGTPEEAQANMGPALAQSAVLALVFGVVLAFTYQRVAGTLWVERGGPLAGMEFGTVLWLPTVALATVGGGVWFDKARPLFRAQFWTWLVRLNVAGLVLGFLM
jgi:hypothetical protein